MSFISSTFVWLSLTGVIVVHAQQYDEYGEVSEYEYDTTDVMNWITAKDELNKSTSQAITFSYGGYFVMFGGSLGEQVWIGSKSNSTASTGAGTGEDDDTVSWTLAGSVRFDNVYPNGTSQTEWQLDPPWCSHQCHTVDLPILYFMRDHSSCYDELFLYQMNLEELVNGSNGSRISIDRLNLTQFYYNATHAESHDGCFYNLDYGSMNNPCVTADVNRFAETQTIFVAMGSRVFVYNVSDRTGYFSSGLFTVRGQDCGDVWSEEYQYNEWVCSETYEDMQHVLGEPACTVDVDGNLWVAEWSGLLWRYSVQDDELIDVRSQYVYDGCRGSKDTLTKTVTTTYTEWCNVGNDTHIERPPPHFFNDYSSLGGGPRMTTLNDGYILVTSQQRDYLLLPNTSKSDAQTRTPYIDIVCAGREHTEYGNAWRRNMPIKSDTGVVWSFGGAVGGDYSTNVSREIVSYSWKEDYRIVINWTESILFGDNLYLQIYIKPGCPDMQFYGDGFNTSALNPFAVEVRMASADAALDIYGFVYIINAAEAPVDGAGDTQTRTYELCYFCELQVQNMIQFTTDDTWRDEELILALDSDCYLCSDGISLDISEDEAGIPYKVNFEILRSLNIPAPFSLDSLTRTVTVSECDPGYGTTEGASTLDCNVCPFNQFSFQSSLDPCISCRGVSQDNLLCAGGNQTELTYNFWIAAYDYQYKELKPFYDIEQYHNASHKDDKIVTVLCPPNYCCQSVGGCDYYSNYLLRPQWWSYDFFPNGTYKHYQPSGYSQDVELENGTWIQQYYDNYDYWQPSFNDEDDYYSWGWNLTTVGALCAIGRDVQVPLCGACLDGYAEILGSAQCADCRHSGDRKGWLPIVFASFLATMFASYYIIFIDSKPNEYSSSLGTKAIMQQDDISGFQTILFKPVLYYFQTLNLILETRGIELWLDPVLDFFNLSFDTIGGEDSKICWSPTLDATGEILVNVLVPVLLMVHLFLPRCCIDKQGYGSCCCCCCKEKKICCCSRTPYFASAFFRILLITIGIMLTVCFKYVTYVEIEDKKLLFYSADKEAFGGWWFGGFFGILLILVAFGVIFRQIKKQDSDARYSSSSIYRKFVKSFKTDFWYWEFVLFSRRFLVALFLAAQFVGRDYTNFIFVVILLIYFGLQIHLKPFAHTRVNRVETLCMLLLISAFVSANFITIDDNDVFVSTILSICILVPLIIVALYLMKIIYHCIRIRSYDESQDDHREERMDKMMKRMPKSFRDVAQASPNALETNLALSVAEDDDELDITAKNTAVNAAAPAVQMVEQPTVAHAQVPSATEEQQNVEEAAPDQVEANVQEDEATAAPAPAVSAEEGNPTLC